MTSFEAYEGFAPISDETLSTMATLISNMADQGFPLRVRQSDKLIDVDGIEMPEVETRTQSFSWTNWAGISDASKDYEVIVSAEHNNRTKRLNYVKVEIFPSDPENQFSGMTADAFVNGSPESGTRSANTQVNETEGQAIVDILQQAELLGGLTPSEIDVVEDDLVLGYFIARHHGGLASSRNVVRSN